MSLSFKRAEQLRLELTAQQQKEIQDLYQSVADDIADRLSVPKRVPSDALRQWYLRDLQKQVNAALEGVGKTTESTIRSNTEKVAKGVVDCNADWLKSVGMPVGSAFSWVPTDIVTSVATGQIYEGPWSLSGAIWADVQTQQRDIQTIIARGIAENKSAFDIAKDLEKYVDPSAVKPWDWSKVYPGVRRVIDYSAQRLARTMVSHAYQQAFVRTTQKNPFVTKYKWEASNSDRVCELCQERDGKLFSKDDLPLDHPNGMCTYTAVIEDSMDQIADRLADWANGAEDSELEAWAKDMYGDQYKLASVAPVHVVVQGKDLSETWQPRSDQFNFEIEDIINAQGFDGMPQVVSKEAFDKAVRESNFIAQRTYSAPDQRTLEAYQDQLYHGKWYVDCSVGGSRFGQGMYSTATFGTQLNDRIISDMDWYARDDRLNQIETFTFAPGARIISHEDIIREKVSFIEALERAGAPEEQVDLIDGLDEGAFAALRGYDAISARENHDGFYCVVLNRTRCIFLGGA